MRLQATFEVQIVPGFDSIADEEDVVEGPETVGVIWALLEGVLDRPRLDSSVLLLGHTVGYTLVGYWRTVGQSTARGLSLSVVAPKAQHGMRTERQHCMALPLIGPDEAGEVFGSLRSLMLVMAWAWDHVDQMTRGVTLRGLWGAKIDYPGPGRSLPSLRILDLELGFVEQFPVEAQSLSLVLVMV